MNKDLITIACYCDSEIKKKYLKNTIENIKTKFPYFDILVHAHYPLDIAIQKMVNYYIFDYSNPITDYFFTYWLNVYNYKKVDCLLKDYGYAALQQFIRSLGFSKSLGYNTMYWTNYDIDLEKTNILEFLSNLKNENIFIEDISLDKKGISLITMKIEIEKYNVLKEKINLEDYKSTDGGLPQWFFKKIIDSSVENPMILSYGKIPTKYDSLSWDYLTKDTVLIKFFKNLVIAIDSNIDKIGILIWDIKIKDINLQIKVDESTVILSQENNFSKNENCLYFILEKDITSVKIEKINEEEIDLEVFNSEKISKIRTFQISNF